MAKLTINKMTYEICHTQTTSLKCNIKELITDNNKIFKNFMIFITLKTSEDIKEIKSIEYLEDADVVVINDKKYFIYCFNTLHLPSDMIRTLKYVLNVEIEQNVEKELKKAIFEYINNKGE